MILTELILTTILIWTLAVITPGPNFFITAHTAIGDKRFFSYFTVLGIVTGTLLWAILGFMGISVIFSAVPWLYTGLKILGGGYLIYLGLNLLLSKKHTQSELFQSQFATAFHCFKLGFLTNLLNPKTAAFMTSLFAVTLPAEAGLEYAAVSIFIVCSISAIWYSLVVCLLAIPMLKSGYQNIRTYLEKAAGGIFIFYGVKLIGFDRSN